MKKRILISLLCLTTAVIMSGCFDKASEKNTEKNAVQEESVNEASEIVDSGYGVVVLGESSTEEVIFEGTEAEEVVFDDTEAEELVFEGTEAEEVVFEGTEAEEVVFDATEAEEVASAEDVEEENEGETEEEEAADENVLTAKPETYGIYVENIGPYNGIASQNGTVVNVNNVHAVKVYNLSGSAIRDAKFVYNDRGEEVTFECSFIPDGRIALLTAGTVQKAGDVQLKYEESQISYVESPVNYNRTVFVDLDENGILHVENVTGKALSNVQIAIMPYNTRREYVGDSYVTEVGDLKVGERKDIDVGLFIANYTVSWIRETPEE